MRNPLVQAFGSLLFSTYLCVSWTPFALLALAIGPFSYRGVYALAHFWTGTVMGLCRVLCGLRYEVHGRENIPPGCAVALWKHSSAFETLADMHVFPHQTWVMKRELVQIPIFGWALRFLRPIAIDRAQRQEAVEQVLRQGHERLNDGLWVMIFPEGTRMAPGETRRYGISGALLAIEHGVPVIPVAHDAGVYWPRRGLLKKPGVIRIVIGKPIETAGRDPREVNAEAQEWIESRVAELTGLPKPRLSGFARGKVQPPAAAQVRPASG